MREPDPPHTHTEGSLTGLDAWLWGDLSSAPPATSPSPLPQPFPQGDSPELLEQRHTEHTPAYQLDEPQSTGMPGSGQGNQAAEFSELEFVYSQPQPSPWSNDDENPLEFTSEAPIAYHIEEIAEDFAYGPEVNRALEARLDQIRQQDYSRRVEMLTDQLSEKYDYGGGLTDNDLVTALRLLDRNLPALVRLRDELTFANVTVKRGSYQPRFKQLSSSDHQLIKLVFGPLLENSIAPVEALYRLGYEGVELTDTERAMLVDALERHTLYREEERALLEELSSMRSDATRCQIVEELDEIFRTLFLEETEILDEAGLSLPNRTALAHKSTQQYNPAQLIKLDSPAGQPLVHRLIEDNLWLVARIARHYMGQGLPLEDLFQEGVLGLYRALERFDVSTGNRLMTYASSWVHQSIGRAMLNKGRIIRLPVHALENLSRIERVTVELEQILGRGPTYAEVGHELNRPAQNVRRLIEIAQPPLALDTVLKESGDEELDNSSSDSLPGELAFTPDAEHSSYMLKQQLDEVLLMLPKRERHLLEMRFGLTDDQPRTLEEVAKALGVTRERVRQIETRIFRKLKYARYGVSKLKDYLSGDISVSERKDDVGVERDQHRTAMVEEKKRNERSMKLAQVFASLGYSTSLAGVEPPSYLARTRAQLAIERENRRQERLKSLREPGLELINDLLKIIETEEHETASDQSDGSYLNELDNFRKTLCKARESLSEIQDLRDFEKLRWWSSRQSIYTDIQELSANLHQVQDQQRVRRSNNGKGLI